MPAIVVRGRAAVAHRVVAGFDEGGQPALVVRGRSAVACGALAAVVVAGLGGAGGALAAVVVAWLDVWGQAAAVVQDRGLVWHPNWHALGERGVADKSQGGRHSCQERRPRRDDDA